MPAAPRPPSPPESFARSPAFAGHEGAGIQTHAGGRIIRFDRAALAHAAPLGASIALHLALVAVAAVVVPRASARIADTIPVELVVIEPTPAVVAAPPAPPVPPAPPKKVTLPKPIVTPPPVTPPPKPVAKVDPQPEPLPAMPPPATTAPPAAPTPTASVAASGSSDASAAPSVQLPSTTSSPASERGNQSGVSLAENAPTRSIASLPPDAGAPTRVAQPMGGYQVRPSYPSTARRLGIQGTALLRVHVLADGRVGEINVEESAGHPDLDQAATDAVRRWRFEPARRGEQAVAMWVRLPVEFRLTK
jgi:periplasmic protein TonB